MSEMAEKVSEQPNEKIPSLAELVTSSGDKVPLRTRWTKIGREKDNDIILQDDGYASRYHAWVAFEQERFWVEDLGSTNGTLLNGQQLERRELLASGDIIKIGDSEMTFVLLEKTG
jgi:pSer/pThr/pTyr-binding forkhead associated (FHA) protein